MEDPGRVRREQDEPPGNPRRPPKPAGEPSATPPDSTVEYIAFIKKHLPLAEKNIADATELMGEVTPAERVELQAVIDNNVAMRDKFIRYLAEHLPANPSAPGGRRRRRKTIRRKKLRSTTRRRA